MEIGEIARIRKLCFFSLNLSAFIYYMFFKCLLKDEQFDRVLESETYIFNMDSANIGMAKNIEIIINLMII